MIQVKLTTKIVKYFTKIRYVEYRETVSGYHLLDEEI